MGLGYGNSLGGSFLDLGTDLGGSFVDVMDMEGKQLSRGTIQTLDSASVGVTRNVYDILWRQRQWS